MRLNALIDVPLEENLVADMIDMAIGVPGRYPWGRRCGWRRRYCLRRRRRHSRRRRRSYHTIERVENVGKVKWLLVDTAARRRGKACRIGTLFIAPLRPHRQFADLILLSIGQQLLRILFCKYLRIDIVHTNHGSDADHRVDLTISLRRKKRLELAEQAVASINGILPHI